MGPTTDAAGSAHEAQLLRLAERRHHLLGWVFAVLAAVIWVAFVEDSVHERERTIAAVAERDANLAAAVEQYLARVLGTTRAVHGLVGAQLVQGREAQERRALQADRLRANDLFEELALCLPDGRVLTAVADGHATAATCARMVAATGTARDLQVLAPVQRGTRLVLPVVQAVVDDRGLTQGLAVAMVPAEILLGVMRSTRLRDKAVVLVSGRDGQPRVGWHSQHGHVADAAGFERLAELRRRDHGTADVGGHAYLAVAHTAPALGLRIAVATAADDALAAFRARRDRLLLACVLATLALATVYVLLARMHREGMDRARALGEARTELEQLNARLDTQVQERTARLEQAYRDLETFSYAVAHDVRAPLAGIAGFARALEPALAAPGQDKARHYLQRILANAARMDELTLHLLELGRLAHAPLHLHDVDLSALAQEVVARLREGDPARAVDVAIEPGLAVRADPVLLRQVLENLLGNAWKFSTGQLQPRIAVRRASASESPDEPAFVVEDNGAGFDSAAAAGLFQPFRRMHGAGEFPGTGVGLAAAQRIVALHGGRIWCEARPGEGARFFVALPGA